MTLEQLRTKGTVVPFPTGLQYSCEHWGESEGFCTMDSDLSDRFVSYCRNHKYIFIKEELIKFLNIEMELKFDIW